MIVLPGITIRTLMAEIVAATHGLTDQNGERVMLGTIEEKNMRMAAKHAIETCIGQSVWMGDEKIVISEQPRQVGIFEYRR